MIIPVILRGTSGARLWPLSCQSFPEKFVLLVGDERLLQLSLELVASPHRHVAFPAAEEHRSALQAQSD